MQIYLDCREHALMKLMPDVETKALILGDVVIERDGKELVIIERKTIADFVASICDGRYEEQSARLQAYDVPNHNVLYLIEGSLKNYKFSIPKKTLLSSMTSLLYGKGFSVVRTESTDDTRDFLMAMFEKLKKEDGYAVVKEGSSSVKKQKKDNITLETIDGLMLSQIPGVSALTAKALLQGRSIAELIAALKENGECLNGITTGEKKPRKISSKLIETVKTFLKIEV
jgi:ERCC4-type nuclease